jgi:hypothetical protein
MPRIAFLSVLAAAVSITAVGLYSALAGPGPIVDFVPSSGGSSEADHNPGGPRSLQAQEGDDSQGGDKVAQAIADEFGVTKEEVLARHNEGIGFGALFKLYKLARAQGISVDDLLATIPVDENGEREFRFGQLRKALTEDQRALYESGPKNLGKLVSAASKAKDKVTAEGEDQGAEPGRARGNGHVPPGRPRNSVKTRRLRSA